jgi:spore coat polysaccharide biosynthesis predicted glycosyltransferase SpsG
LKRIIYITDGNEQQGLGHIYQSKTFASYLKKESNDEVDISFLTKSDESVISLIVSDGFVVTKCDSDSEIFECIKQKQPNIVIFDKIDVCPVLAKNIKEQIGCKLFIFTNLTSANNYADLYVMAAMGTHFKNVRIIENGKTICLGPKYLVLREEFFNYPKRINTDEKLKNVLIQFGGADPAGLTFEAIKTLSKIKDPLNIYAVIGISNLQKREIEKFVYENGLSERVNILSNVRNVAELMSKADLCLVSPGISFFESLFMGVPVMCFYQNQMQFDAWYEDVKLFSKNDLANMKTLIENKCFILPGSDLVKQMDIAEGMSELSEIIMNE